MGDHDAMANLFTIDALIDYGPALGGEIRGRELSACRQSEANCGSFVNGAHKNTNSGIAATT